MIGRVFLGRYEAVRLLGEGGMGRVYLARQIDLGRQVVVKVMHDHIAADPRFRDRFERECHLMAGFQHPYAVTLYDASLTDPHGPCLIMEYVKGTNLEALLAKKSHIVMTSDTYPKGLVDIHERLISRFDSGLTVAIEPPELEMRVAILINKARQENAEMPEEVAFFVAKNVRSNVRELEGALRKILAYSRFNQKEISIQLAREALRDLLSIQNRQISVENIQKTVADYYKIKVADMYSKKRPASIARPRQIAMYLAKELTQKSLPEIGELFGGRDHTTVLHAVRKISGERQQLTELNQQLHVLEQTLKG